MGTTCSINVNEKLYIEFAELLKKRPSEDLDVDGRIR